MNTVRKQALQNRSELGSNQAKKQKEWETNMSHITQMH